MRTRALLAGLLLLAAAGCGRPDHVRLTVTPGDALYDAPLTARASGLNPHEKVTATLTLPDHAVHDTWTGHTTMTADGEGRITARLDHLIGLLRLPHDQQHTFLFEDFHRFSMKLRLSDGGHRLAKATVRRETPQSAGRVMLTRLRPGHDGLYANLYEPATITGTASAVVVWGGSEGGITGPDRQAALLAAHGHPALALAYFGEPGIPQKLLRVPVEYFGAAVRRLRAAPHVDPSRVYVWGVSRGSEAAGLTALHYPDLVHGVIDGVPSSVLHRALGVTGASRPAWTFGGRGLPIGVPVTDPRSSAVPAARLRFEDFPGKVLAMCARSDRIWPSCLYARTIEAENPSHVTLLSYAGAGHLIGLAVPNVPSSLKRLPLAGGGVETFGGTPEADQRADADLWPKVLAFLDS